MFFIEKLICMNFCSKRLKLSPGAGFNEFPYVRTELFCFRAYLTKQNNEEYVIESLVKETKITMGGFRDKIQSIAWRHFALFKDSV